MINSLNRRVNAVNESCFKYFNAMKSKGCFFIIELGNNREVTKVYIPCDLRQGDTTVFHITSDMSLCFNCNNILCSRNHDIKIDESQRHRINHVN